MSENIVTLLKFRIYRTDDLFEPRTIVVAKAWDGKELRVAQFEGVPREDQVESVKRSFSARFISETIQQMLNTRMPMDVWMRIGPEKKKAVERVKNGMSFMAGLRSLVGIANYASESILPQLWLCRPGNDSRYYPNYIKRFEALKTFLTTICQSPDTALADVETDNS